MWFLRIMNKKTREKTTARLHHTDDREFNGRGGGTLHLRLRLYLIIAIGIAVQHQLDQVRPNNYNMADNTHTSWEQHLNVKYGKIIYIRWLDYKRIECK